MLISEKIHPAWLLPQEEAKYIALLGWRGRFVDTDLTAVVFVWAGRHHTQAIHASSRRPCKVATSPCQSQGLPAF
jgi:hypothetical protein